MYYSFSSKKIRTVAFVAMLLAIAVFVTFEAKRSLYGETGFSLIFTRVLGMEYRALLYNGRVASFGDRNEASTAKSVARAIPVLTYHAIMTEDNKEEVSPESFEGHNVHLNEFEAQMFALKNAGWETITIKEFTEAMNGATTIPEKSFVLTFDDGAKESFYPVDPVLRALGYEAVTYILPTFSAEDGTYYYLSRSEILRAIESGRWEIGSHGLNTHYFIPTNGEGEEGAALANRRWLPEYDALETMDAYRTRVAIDLAESKRQLESILGRTVTTFAYPFGDYGQLSKNTPEAEEIVTSTASDRYDFSLYQWWPGEGFTSNYIDHDRDDTMIKRISVHPSWSGDDLLALMDRGLPKPLPFSDSFDSDSGWLSIWGEQTFANGDLQFSPLPNESGSAAILDGSGHWEDYSLHVEAESPARTGVAVYVRFKDNNNHAICNFGNGFAHVEQMVDGEHRVIKGNRSTDYVIPDGPYTLDVRVEGRRVECSLNGSVLVDTDFLDESLTHGGIGFKAWDREIGKSVFFVKTLQVEAVKSS